MSIINENLLMISEQISNSPMVSVTYFKQDEKKTGGEYLTITGSVKKIDDYECCIKMGDNTVIPFDNIIRIAAEWID